MEFIGYTAALLMGIVVGLIGGGGSILTVPILVYLFGVATIDATTSSLLIVGVTALFAAVQYIRRGEVNFKSGAQFAFASFFGIFFSRKIVLPNMPEKIISTGLIEITSPDFVLFSFAAVMLFAAFSMLRGPKEIKPPPNNSKFRTAAYGVTIGAVTGFIGAGGGFLVVPALVSLLGLKMRTAIGTSLVIIAANSLFGFTVSFLHNKNLNWPLQLVIILLAVLGSLAGSWFSEKVDEKKLKKGFGVLLVLIGLFISFELLAGALQN